MIIIEKIFVRAPEYKKEKFCGLGWRRVSGAAEPLGGMPREARQTERSGGPHSKAFGLLRGKQKARIFVYPVGKRNFYFGARPRFPPPPNFVPVKLARRPKLAVSKIYKKRAYLNYKFSRHYRFCELICLTNIYPF